MKLLVTGGAGYIGSHTVVELLQNGHDVAIVDNYCNSSPVAIQRIKAITGKTVTVHALDVRDVSKLKQFMKHTKFDAVIHFAGLKAVGESTAKPLSYYDNNVGGIISLLEAVQGSSIKKFIFSSSASVYGRQPIPYTEQTARTPENPYGTTKYVAELVMADYAIANTAIAMIALRYFNPIGAHQSGLLGEDSNGVPNNLMPFMTQVLTGKREKLKIFGNDYATRDGTGIRDYIHVVDLAKGHLAALANGPVTGFKAYNLGTGHGHTVLELLHAYEHASGKEIPYEIAPRRSGDLAEYYADPSLANKELSWKADLTIEDACRDNWKWQMLNPKGYNTGEIIEQ